MELLRVRVSLNYKNGYSVSSKVWNAEKKKLVYVAKCDYDEIAGPLIRYIRIEDLGTYLVRTSHSLDMIEVLSWIKKTDNSLEEATEVSKLKILKEISRLDNTFEQLKLKSK